MVNYISLPILSELVRFAEHDSGVDDSVKAMASGILSYYFPPTNGFTVAPEQNRLFADPPFILEIKRLVAGDRRVVNHAFAGVIKSTDSLQGSLVQLQNALDYAIAECGSHFWAILVHGCTFYFYEYRVDLPLNARLVPWGPPDQPSRNSFHARNDSITIDWMLRHMAQNNTPSPR